jgi:hypothetical protein
MVRHAKEIRKRWKENAVNAFTAITGPLLCYLFMKDGKDGPDGVNALQHSQATATHIFINMCTFFWITANHRKNKKWKELKAVISQKNVGGGKPVLFLFHTYIGSA